jgi:hypothetical protein
LISKNLFIYFLSFLLISFFLVFFSGTNERKFIAKSSLWWQP